MVGTRKIQDDATENVWEMVLGPKEKSGLHTHHFNWSFVVTKAGLIQIIDESDNVVVPPAMLEVGESMEFILDGEMAYCKEKPEIRIPRTHQAVNLGETEYREILVELKGM